MDMLMFSTMWLQHWWVREENHMSSPWTCAKHFSLTHKTALSLEWAAIDLMGITLMRKWLDGLTRLRTAAQWPSGGQDTQHS